MGSKICRICSETKPIEAFWRSKFGRGGFANECKECTKASKREYWKARPEQLLARRAKQRDLNAALREKYRKQHPERIAANDAFKRALQKGIVKKHPCWVCGEEKSEGHHADYKQPLDVVWLCRLHHRQAHALARELERKNADH
ncbi:hypothetical protein [Paraburkholderia sp. RL18-085-BIA-A]|uniref:hypothetical protein n=1 Tax=Paraburkholderia sp. RL18-085-BIA-A TaxID=3031633 RepID=UPI0038BCAB8A